MRANLIAGQWTAGKQTNPDINPSDVSDVIDQYASGDAAAVDAAVAAARAAFPAWSGSTPQQRFDALDFAGSEILARRAELGELLAREEGKTLPEATGEAARAGQIFKFFAGEALRTAGEIIPSIRPGMSVEVTREPIGVVGLITPWNFPIAIPAWKIAPALAYGNCVVFKPADLVPGCGWALADILSRSGLPAGVFNLVMGRGAVVGEAIIHHPGIDGISFTGSQAVGRRVSSSRTSATSRSARTRGRGCWPAASACSATRTAITSRRRCSPRQKTPCASAAKRSSDPWRRWCGRAITTRRSRWPTIPSSAFRPGSAPPRSSTRRTSSATRRPDW